MKKLSSFIMLSIMMCSSLLAQQWTWQNPLPQGNTITSLKFVNATTGFGVGTAGTVIRTTDAGSTWTVLSTGLKAQLLSVYFSDAATGWAVGDSGYIAKTTDAGSNWTKQSVDASISLYAVYFSSANALVGCAVGGAMSGWWA